MPGSMTIITLIALVMVTINSSVNFIIYYFLGESFRKESKKMAEESREQFQKWLVKFFWNILHYASYFFNIFFFRIEWLRNDDVYLLS